MATSRYKDSLICDYAEYYKIYNIDELPLDFRATLFSGLPHESRTILKLMGQPVKTEILLQASIVDKLDALLGAKKQEPLVSIFFNKNKKQKSEIRTFRTKADFEEQLKRLRKG